MSYLAHCPPSSYLSKELSLCVSLGHWLAIYFILVSGLPPSKLVGWLTSTVIIRFTILFTIMLPWGKIRYPGILHGEVLQWWFCALAELTFYWGIRNANRTGRPAHGPHRLQASTWHSLIGLQRRFQRLHAEFTAEERVAPLYIYEGRGSISNITKHPSNQVTLSRCSSSSLVEVLGLEEFRFES